MHVFQLVMNKCIEPSSHLDTDPNYSVSANRTMPVVHASKKWQHFFIFAWA